MNEIDGTVEFRIGVIEGNLAAPVTINFATSDGSAFGRFMEIIKKEIKIAEWSL